MLGAQAGWRLTRGTDGCRRTFMLPSMVLPQMRRFHRHRIGLHRTRQPELTTHHGALTIAGVEVTLVDANHCPGAVQFLFQLPNGGPRYVHCGDMRFCAALKEDAHLQRFVGARAVFLDTTYCNPRFTFPLQVVACPPQEFDRIVAGTALVCQSIAII